MEAKMSDEKEITKVAENVVVKIDYTLVVDGEEIDSSKEEGPLEYLQGHANIIPGLERELDGMAVGDNKKVVVAPADGYGEFSDEAIMDVPRGEFPEEIPLEVGIQLQVTDKEGDMALATIVEVGDETVKLDMNHPLAGQELHFDVTVVELRAATDEELAHGHVHSGHHHH
jgi:FKBP-type peptidyl-prolyl cis-trans isomerase SlyD